MANERGDAAMVVKVDLTFNGDEYCPFLDSPFLCRVQQLLCTYEEAGDDGGVYGCCNGNWDDAPANCPLRKGPIVVEAQ